MSPTQEFILNKYTNYVKALNSLTKDEMINFVISFRNKVVSTKCSNEDIKLIDMLVNILEIEIEKLKNIL
jgi:hypothetical protein